MKGCALAARTLTVPISLLVLTTCVHCACAKVRIAVDIGITVHHRPGCFRARRRLPRWQDASFLGRRRIQRASGGTRAPWPMPAILANQ